MITDTLPKKNIDSKMIHFILLILFIMLLSVIFVKVKTYRIFGHSMNPTLTEGEIVLSVKTSKYKRGDIVALEIEGTTSIKRIIGLPGDKVFIDDDGNVFVNDQLLEEKYVKEKAKGEIEIPNPYQLKKGEYYILGDNRGDSKDSRLIKVACIKEEKIYGKIVFSISKVKKL